MAGNGIDGEVFAPATLLVTHDGREQMLELVGPVQDAYADELGASEMLQNIRDM